MLRDKQMWEKAKLKWTKIEATKHEKEEEEEEEKMR